MAFGKQKTSEEYLKLEEDFKSGSFKQLYLIYGSEEYLKLNYKKRFRITLGGDDEMNYNFYDGAPDPDELISVLETMPFMISSDRLVIISDSSWFKKQPPEKVADYISHIPETSHLVFIEKDVDKRSKFYKEVTKYGTAVEINEMGRDKLSGWAAKYLGKAGKNIRSSTMQLFLDTCDNNMDNIVSELEKVIAYVGERSVVEDEDIRIICTQRIEDRVFDMISEMGLGHKDKAMKLYADLMALQQAPMKILAIMRRNFNQLLLARECVTKGRSKKESAAYIGVSEWIVGKLTDQARNYTKEALERYIIRCRDYDEAIKLGNMTDRMAVELLLTT